MLTYFSTEQAYEVANMLPSETCATVAAATTRLFLLSVPRRLVPFAEKVIATLLYDRLRESVLCVDLLRTDSVFSVYLC